jgi:hypothetical protein
MSMLWLLLMVACMFATEARARSTPVPKNGPGATVVRTAATVLGRAFGSSQHPALPSELLIKFTGSFRIGLVSLPADAYRFRNAEPGSANSVLLVLSHDLTRAYALVHTLPALRDKLDAVSILFDRPRPDAPPRIKGLFWPGLMEIGTTFNADSGARLSQVTVAARLERGNRRGHVTIRNAASLFLVADQRRAPIAARRSRSSLCECSLAVWTR